MTTKANLLSLILALPICAIFFSSCAAPSPVPRSAESSYKNDGVAESTPEKRRNRAGLGTSWGEARSSHVEGIAFTRASSKPNSTLSIRYNDADGIPSDTRSASQPFDVGGIAEVGIKSNGRYLKARNLGEHRAYLYSRVRYEVDPVVIGKHGQRYSIFVKNRTSERIEVVLSVDGLDVLDGKSASTRKRGYVIKPHGRLTVEGFRRSFESVAAFRFGSVDSSYAARSTGSTRNVGVIGAAVFKEKPDHDWDVRKHADPFPGERGSGQFARPPGR